MSATQMIDFCLAYMRNARKAGVSEETIHETVATLLTAYKYAVG